MKQGVSQSPVQSDATNMFFLSRAAEPYVSCAVSTSPPTCSPSSSLLALEARWKASSLLALEARWMASLLLATGSGLVFFGMLTLHEARHAGVRCRVERFFGMLARVQAEAGSWRRWRRQGRSRVRVDSVRVGVLLVPRAVDVVL